MQKIDGIIEGWRLFKFTTGKKNDSMLSSISANDNIIAPRRANKAKHIGGISNKHIEHNCPCVGKNCGFNMFKYGVTLPYETKAGIFYHDFAFIARCYGWGKTIPGEFGFRCEYMYPKSLMGVILRDKVVNLSSLENISQTINRAIDKDHLHKDLWRIARLYKIKIEWQFPVDEIPNLEILR
jgi:hypothetical protein